MEDNHFCSWTHSSLLWDKRTRIILSLTFQKNRNCSQRFIINDTGVRNKYTNSNFSERFREISLKILLATAEAIRKCHPYSYHCWLYERFSIDIDVLNLWSILELFSQTNITSLWVICSLEYFSVPSFSEIECKQNICFTHFLNFRLRGRGGNSNKRKLKNA